MDTRAGMRLIGLPAVIRRLDKLKWALDHGPYAQSVAAVDRWVQQNFRGQGDKVGGWEPLSAATYYGGIKGKKVTKTGITAGMKKHILNRKILQQKGNLRSKWHHNYDNKSGSLVSGVFYGIYHDSDKPRKKLPRRRILPTNKEMWPKIEKIFAAHIERSFHG